MEKTAPLAERALIEVQAGCDVGDVQDRVAELHRRHPSPEPRNLRKTNTSSIRWRLYTRYPQ
jgi:hypothetical protein